MIRRLLTRTRPPSRRMVEVARDETHTLMVDERHAVTVLDALETIEATLAGADGRLLDGCVANVWNDQLLRHVQCRRPTDGSDWCSRHLRMLRRAREEAAGE